MFLPTFMENCPHIWKKPAPSEQNTHFWGEIKSEIVPFFLYGPVTYTTGIFFKKIDQNRSVLPLAVLKRFYTRLYWVATGPPPFGLPPIGLPPIGLPLIGLPPFGLRGHLD